MSPFDASPSAAWILAPAAGRECVGPAEPHDAQVRIQFVQGLRDLRILPRSLCLVSYPGRIPSQAHAMRMRRMASVADSRRASIHATA